MAQEVVVQVCCGKETSCPGVLAQDVIVQCVVAQELVVQVCYGIGHGCSGVLWYRKWFCRFIMAQKNGHMMTTTNSWVLLQQKLIVQHTATVHSLTNVL